MEKVISSVLIPKLMELKKWRLNRPQVENSGEGGDVMTSDAQRHEKPN